jgi:hypothetical protein
MKDGSIERGLPGWLEPLADHAQGAAMFTGRLLDDGWHSGDVAVFYARYAYDKQFRELIQFCDTGKLRFEILCKENANTFRLLVCRAADYEKLLQSGQFSEHSSLWFTMENVAETDNIPIWPVSTRRPCPFGFPSSLTG